MKVLILHGESVYFAGAQKVLGYYLEGLIRLGFDVEVAGVPTPRVLGLIPAGLRFHPIPDNQRFSVPGLVHQARAVRKIAQAGGHELLHGWTARDWELTVLAGRSLRLPTVGTLHDHPRAPFISSKRRLLMKLSARYGLDRVVCVSEAVRRACEQAGYPRARLDVITNGLPASPADLRSARGNEGLQIGFLGAFSERKGLKGLFQMVDRVASGSDRPWRLIVAVDPQDEAGELLLQGIKSRYSTRDWWPRVSWLGWIADPARFLSDLDLLVCPSSDFDPFPTVLLEAGRAGIPVLAARVGGVAEIVDHGQNGWLFEAGNWPQGAALLAQLILDPGSIPQAGQVGRQRFESMHGVERMVNRYSDAYRALA